MASPPSFRISPETPSGPTDLFFLIAAILFLMILVSMVKVSLEFLSCIFGMFTFHPTARVRGPGCEADDSRPSSAAVKNEWSYTSAPAYVFVNCKGTALL